MHKLRVKSEEKFGPYISILLVKLVNDQFNAYTLLFLMSSMNLTHTLFYLDNTNQGDQFNNILSVIQIKVSSGST